MFQAYSYRTEIIDVRGLFDKGRREVTHDYMNSAGAEGWELVSVVPIPGLWGPESAILFFKRPLPGRVETLDAHRARSGSLVHGPHASGRGGDRMP